MNFQVAEDEAIDMEAGLSELGKNTGKIIPMLRCDMQKKDIDENVIRNEDRYRDFSKRLADSIWVVDANTLKVLFVSDLDHDLRGYNGKEVVGSCLREITTDDSYQMALIELTKARREYEKGKDPVSRLEIECYKDNSRTIWLEMAARFVREEGEPLQLVGISRDISDRKFAEMNKGHLLKMYMEALSEEHRLRSDIQLFEKLLPICSGCRRIRGDGDRWWPLEAFAQEISDRRPADVFCPECAHMHHPGD